MSTRPQTPEPAEAPYVSTGHLPPPEQVRNLVAEAYERYKSNTDGQNSQVYPALAGFAGAALVPTLAVLIADHYRGKQQAEAVGWLGSARAITGVLAFIVVGSVATWLSWRWAFGLLILHAAAILLLSFKLKPSVGRPEVQIDLVGVLLSAVAIICITFGFNNLRNWGLLLARPAA